MVGEKIDVMTSSGGKVVSGFVEEVSPMRTHLRTDHWLSVMVPNKVAKTPPQRCSLGRECIEAGVLQYIVHVCTSYA